KPHDEGVLPDSDEQVPVEEEADTAEHFLLLDVLAPSQLLPDAFGESFIESHWRLRSQDFIGRPSDSACTSHRSLSAHRRRWGSRSGKSSRGRTGISPMRQAVRG